MTEEHRSNRDKNRPQRKDDLTQQQKDAIRALTMLKMHQLGAMIVEHGIETVVAHPIHIERFLNAKMTSIFSEEETEKLPIYPLIKKHQWVLTDPKCLQIGPWIAQNIVNKFAVSDGEPMISVAALQYMPDYKLAQMVFTLGHNSNYRPSRNESFKWERLTEEVGNSLSYEEYKKVLAEGTRLFHEAVPNTFENLLILANRDTSMLERMKKCRPQQKAPKPPNENEQEGKPSLLPEAVPELKLSSNDNLGGEGNDPEDEGPEPLNDEEGQEILEDQTDLAPATEPGDTEEDVLF